MSLLSLFTLLHCCWSRQAGVEMGMQGEQWRRVGGQVEGGQRPGGSSVGTSDVPSAIMSAC